MSNNKVKVGDKFKSTFLTPNQTFVVVDILDYHDESGEVEKNAIAVMKNLSYGNVFDTSIDLILLDRYMVRL